MIIMAYIAWKFCKREIIDAFVCTPSLYFVLFSIKYGVTYIFQLLQITQVWYKIRILDIRSMLR